MRGTCDYATSLGWPPDQGIEMDTQHLNENAVQCKSCRGEGDTNFWGARTSDNHDKQVHKCPTCQVFKSGPLFISSKGIGWTSWKKRWFILTRTSLVFFRNDPNAPAQKGSEVNLTLGGIDLNNSGSVVVRADKKLLTVLFPDGRDGRAFTLKAETLEDMYEWKTALENALAQAPSAALVMGQTGIFRNDMMESIETSFEQWRDKRPVRSMIVGRPILLALEDIDGSPSFLEKALRFIEEYGIKVEGILRQSADVEEVERWVQEYEQGKKEFSPDEDAHVICDCIKHVLRELPSSPVPASCCTALLEALRSNRGARVNAIRTVVSEILPEPNRHLLQRILKMMRLVASHKSENRMTVSAVAACMAPLLLRPLLAGDCELEDGFDMGGDGSVQLLQAAAAANHAQAIVIIFLEEYEKIFVEGAFASELYSGSEDCDDEDEDDEGESTDDAFLEDEGYHDAQNDLDPYLEDDPENASSGSLDESGSDLCGDLSENEALECHNSCVVTSEFKKDTDNTQKHTETTPSTVLQHIINEELSFSTDNTLPRHDGLQKSCSSICENRISYSPDVTGPHEYLEDIPCSTSQMQKSVSSITPCATKLTDKSNAPVPINKRPTVWGRTSARKNLSLESIEYSSEDENVIQRLEVTKSDLQVKIAKEVQVNAMLQASLERRKEALHERRLALEQDVKRLQEQLRKERDLRTSLEAGLMNMRPGQVYITSLMDHKMRADLEEIALAEADVISLKQKVADLRGQLNQQRQQNYSSLSESCGQQQKDQQKYVDTPSSAHHGEDSTRKEEVLSVATNGNVKTQKGDLSLSQNRQTSRKCDTETKGQGNTISLGVGNYSFGGMSSSNGANAYSKKSVMSESAGFRVEHENLREPNEDPSGYLNKLPLEKQLLSNMTVDAGKSLGTSLSSSIEETSSVGAIAASKKSVISEDSTSISSSAALARLTNRLNFLKERRLQLVNELQSLEAGHSQDPEGPPQRPDSR
uniref:Rho GTPase-activating protein 15 n=1 Tax=Anthurium amnicola TaxID=1678845 RepID=A0A1D1Y130_9ARAE